jgi:hypothetical protein
LTRLSSPTAVSHHGLYLALTPRTLDSFIDFQIDEKKNPEVVLGKRALGKEKKVTA